MNIHAAAVSALLLASSLSACNHSTTPMPTQQAQTLEGNTNSLPALGQPVPVVGLKTLGGDEIALGSPGEGYTHLEIIRSADW